MRLLVRAWGGSWRVLLGLIRSSIEETLSRLRGLCLAACVFEYDQRLVERGLTPMSMVSLLMLARSWFVLAMVDIRAYAWGCMSGDSMRTRQI